LRRAWFQFKLKRFCSLFLAGQVKKLCAGAATACRRREKIVRGDGPPPEKGKMKKEETVAAEIFYRETHEIREKQSLKPRNLKLFFCPGLC